MRWGLRVRGGEHGTAIAVAAAGEPANLYFDRRISSAITARP